MYYNFEKTKFYSAKKTAKIQYLHLSPGFKRRFLSVCMLLCSNVTCAKIVFWKLCVVALQYCRILYFCDLKFRV